MGGSEIDNFPARIVHLLGGLRAVDPRDGSFYVQTVHGRPLARFAAPAYPALYARLTQWGVVPIGAEFLLGGRTGAEPPDWQCGSPRGGFHVMTEQLAWQEIRWAAYHDKEVLVADFASRAKSYLALLPIRILQLSEWYNRTLTIANGPRPDRFFSNLGLQYIDAAIHAFLSDAASFRDLIAEGVWRFVVRGAGDVTTLSTLLKKAAGSTEPLVAKMLLDGAPGGWLKTFSDLRNSVTHVAPVGRSQHFHKCQGRLLKLGKLEIVTLHYPLLTSTGEVYRTTHQSLDFNDEEAIKAQLEDYRTYCSASIDGLRYAWETVARLVEMLEALRNATSFRRQLLHLTDDDIIGKVEIVRAADLSPPA